jgi:hypothetical protein
MHLKIGTSGLLWVITIGFSFFVFIPLYFFNGIRKPEAKLNTIIVTCLFAIFMSLQFLMVNLKPLTTSQTTEKTSNAALTTK